MKLSKVQADLSVPKSRYNSFGGYHYRSLEDILDAVKPLLAREGLTLTITDTIVEVGGRLYVKAIATVTDGKETHVCEAYAREAETKKGMDESQITGTASSYARKYCLNGLFLIDDIKDADTDEHTAQTRQEDKPAQDDDKPWLDETKKREWENAEAAVTSGKIRPEDLRKHYKVSRANMDHFKRLVG